MSTKRIARSVTKSKHTTKSTPRPRKCGAEHLTLEDYKKLSEWARRMQIHAAIAQGEAVELRRWLDEFQKRDLAAFAARKGVRRG